MIGAAYELLHEYQFKLGVLSTCITIRTLRPIRGQGIYLEQSHFIKTPRQIDPYQPGNPWGNDEEFALAFATTSVTRYYDEALLAGYLPSEEWLVPNSRFR
jgi:hypothetical protein